MKQLNIVKMMALRIIYCQVSALMQQFFAFEGHTLSFNIEPRLEFLPLTSGLTLDLKFKGCRLDPRH